MENVDMFEASKIDTMTEAISEGFAEKEKRYRVPAICVLMHKHGELFPLAFKEWLPVNLHIWHAFQQQAVAVYRKGFKHYSARTIVHVLRHHSALNETGGNGRSTTTTRRHWRVFLTSQTRT